MNDISTEPEPEVVDSGQNPLPDMTDAALNRDPEDKLRVLCARSPIIKQLVRGAVYAKVAPAFDHNIAIWSIEDARRHTGQALVRIYNHVGDPVDYFAARPNRAALDARIGGPCSYPAPDPNLSSRDLVVSLYGLGDGVLYEQINCPSCDNEGCVSTGHVDDDLDVYFQCQEHGCDGSDAYYEFYQSANAVAESIGAEPIVWRDDQVCCNTDCANYDHHTVTRHTGRHCSTHKRVICRTDCCGTLQEVSDEN